MNRYFSSFFITTILYLVGTIFLFYTFADILIVEEKKQEVKTKIDDKKKKLFDKLQKKLGGSGDDKAAEEIR